MGLLDPLQPAGLLEGLNITLGSLVEVQVIGSAYWHHGCLNVGHGEEF